MSNFWAQKLGGAAAVPAAPATAPQQASTAPWWASPTPTYPAPAAPQQTVPEQPQQEAQSITEALRDPTRVPKKALVAKQRDVDCPNCGQDTFLRPLGMPNAMPQCSSCGHNPRFEQMTASMPSNRGGEGAATPTRQIASGGARGQSNYHPGTFIRADGTV